MHVDPARPLQAQPGVGHNRWHPDVPPVLTVDDGEPFTLETIDVSDAFITPQSTPEDLVRFPTGGIHPLTGPVHVRGAAPGDVVEVEILATEAGPFAWTGVTPGEGVLPDLVREPVLRIWRISGDVARCDAIPGVAIPAAVFPGTIGVAPAHAFVAEAGERERALRDRGGEGADPEADDAIPVTAAGGLRTLPPRENGGNIDVRQLVAGSRLFVTAQVHGALLSIGDVHFAQGEGELAAVALEMAGAVTMCARVHRDQRLPPRTPVVFAPPGPPRPRVLVSGFPITGDGGNRDNDLHLAVRNAVHDLVSWISARHGLEPADAYIVASLAADLRLSQVVNRPNATVCAALALDVFDDPAGSSARDTWMRLDARA